MATPFIGKDLQTSIRMALSDAQARRHASLTLEHLLLALTSDSRTRKVLIACGANVERLRRGLEKFLAEKLEPLPEGNNAPPRQTLGIERVLQRAALRALSIEQATLEGEDLLVPLFREDDSHASFFLQQEGVTQAGLADQLSLAAESPRVLTQLTVPRDVWVALVRYRSERMLQLER
jgi:ATP-dependent Clp protease ATP-binding subunit ClpA